MQMTTGFKTLLSATALLCCAGLAQAAEGLGGMGADAMKEQAVDKAMDTASGMAKDHAKSAMGLDDAVTADDIDAEAEADAAAAEAAGEPAPERVE